VNKIVMSKFYAIAAFLFLTLSSNAEASKLIVIEVSQDSIKVDGTTTANLPDKLNSMGSCERVHLIVDKNVEPEKIVNTMDIVKSANCAKISIQSV
jgi:biopolymer transport protein ExbD